MSRALARLMARIVPKMAAVPAKIGPGPASRVCGDTRRGFMHCMSWVRTDIAPRPAPAGYGPTQLQSAYSLPSATQGLGQVVAIVDAYDDPNAESDLAVYRSTFGLAPCTTGNGCFIKVNQNGVASGYPSADSGWALEISLDLDMVSAVCPKCDIILVEANSNFDSDLYTADDTAATTCGANVVSNSWGGPEYSSEQLDESNFNHVGVVMTFASGDNGYESSYPSSSQYVTSVGGTSLSGGPPWSETVWSGSGSWCSQYIAQPSWQAALGSTYTSVCGMRISNDVAAVADPSTGLAVYDTYPSGGWLVVGGTSAATPIIGSVYALAGNEGSITAGSYPYSHSASLNDILSGSNGSCGGTYLCTAQPGFDGPSGWGTPNGTGGF
ncbi:MAG: S53 family peptidase [Candidatus Eremiobacteraeota bacterium]|nr:S53 family peptidase [Candidatus Eremiobacteraeota bacterium]MBV8366452.1 S53 family peptidase [Candidatus Eremiobacteraeota bacterium]